MQPELDPALKSAGYRLEPLRSSGGICLPPKVEACSNSCCPCSQPCAFFFRGRADTALEVLALRQQVAVLKRQRPRPTLTCLDRVFWTTLRHVWPRWANVLLIVKPETVVRWHRAGFRLYWRWRSRRGRGRPRITEEMQTLIRLSLATIPPRPRNSGRRRSE